jgi:hypothetical protein
VEMRHAVASRMQMKSTDRTVVQVLRAMLPRR